MTIKNIGQALLDKNLVSAKDLETARNNRENTFLKALMHLNILEENRLADFIANYLQLPRYKLEGKKNDLNVMRLVPGEIARRFSFIPLYKINKVLIVAMADPLDYRAIEELEFHTQCRIEPVVANLTEINTVLDQHFGVFTSIKKIIDDLNVEGLSKVALGNVENQVFQASSTTGPVNRILHLIISHAIKERASDIHFEPVEEELNIRFRIDGVLRSMMTFPKHLSNSLISSIKILAKMDIAEKRVPLDGGFQVKVENRIIDLRISSFPVIEGEKIVIRLLDKENVLFNLEDLGMLPETLEKIIPVISKTYGIILVTGPTGSGKTTTLYAILNRIKSVEKNIVTIEDPIEYHLDLINQSQVNPKAGLTFARGLRSFLRQDPDIILVGEIRDQETAEISFQAALTGHLVFSTLHTNDAASTVTRLIDMGIEPFLVSSSVIGVLAQRLVRRVCGKCRVEYQPDEEVLGWAGLKNENHKFYKGEGCPDCQNSGYKGRMGLFELMIPGEEMQKLLGKENVTAGDVKQLAEKEGIVTFKEDGIKKALAGDTTLEEVMRVIR
ncbi:MAG: GspE/PulE family protein [Candidatus Margulisbacteria bacterium]|nr:GspE/PulE family protein [Candidatus Margulisiibacteriota bacterium]